MNNTAKVKKTIEIILSVYDDDRSQELDVKKDVSYTRQTEYKTFRNNLANKFKPRKRRMGNLILISDTSVVEKIDGLEDKSGIYNEHANKTLGRAIGGMLSKVFHSSQMSTLGPVKTEGSELVYLEPHVDLREHRTVQRRLSRIFTRYMDRDILRTQEEIGGYYNINRERRFNRFSELEQALDAKVYEPDTVTKMGSDYDCISQNSSTGPKLSANGQNEHRDQKLFGINNTNSKMDSQFVSNDVPKTESAMLENIVFSPYTHRPSLRDIPGIENIATSSTNQKWGYPPCKQSGMRFIIKPKEHVSYGTSSKPARNRKFNNLGEEIDSHLYCQSRNTPISKCFSHRGKKTQIASAESSHEATDLLSDIQTPSAATSANSLSESITAIRGILKRKYQSNFTRDKNRRQNVCVRSVSPKLTPIEMKNNEVVNENK